MEEGHSSKKKNNSAKKSRVVVDEETGFVRKKQKLSRAVKKTLAKKKLSKEKEEIEALCATIASQPPALDGRVPEETSAETHFAASLSFDQLPISKATKTGLKQAKFEKMTAIQRAAIPQVSLSDHRNFFFFFFFFKKKGSCWSQCDWNCQDWKWKDACVSHSSCGAPVSRAMDTRKWFEKTNGNVVLFV